MKKLYFILVLFFSLIISAQSIETFGPNSPNVLKKVAGFGESLSCEINILCDSSGFQSVSNGVFLFNGATAFFLANTNNDGRRLFMTANHVFPANIAVGGSTTIAVKFDYQSVSCDNPATEPTSSLSSLAVKLLARLSSDQVLCEIIDENFPVINITLLGWDTRYAEITSATDVAFIGHPKADIKKISYPVVSSSTSSNILTRVNQGNGAVETGYSGSPLLGKSSTGSIYVYGSVSSGSMYGCGSNPQSYVTAKSIGAEWNTLKPFLDPLNLGVEYHDGLSTALPVELVSFIASSKDDIVTLNWKTATEVNNYGFEIERKLFGLDENNWKKIGFVEGHGNSNSPKEYFFKDHYPIGGNQFEYRLKQIDFDGIFEYSDIVVISLKVKKFTLEQNYPNPFNPTTTIKFSIPENSFVSLKVYDVLGQEIISLVDEVKNYGNYEVDFNASNLPSGTYVYKLVTNSFIKIRKMILIK